jgi:Fe-S cluster biosynthesis and repair protein YggX
MLINERRLNMMNAEDRKFLQTEMDKFLSGEEYAQAEGYVPPSE